jgi:hypothetical protein
MLKRRTWFLSPWFLVAVVLGVIGVGAVTGMAHREDIFVNVERAVYAVMAVLMCWVVHLQSRVARLASSRANIATLVSYAISAAGFAVGAVMGWEQLPWVTYGLGTTVLFYAISLKKKELGLPKG